MATNQRKYPRIYLAQSGELKKILGVQAIWPDSQKTDLFDLSYTGCAIGKPKGPELERGAQIPLRISFADQDPIAVPGSVVRGDSRMVGVQFGELSSQARIAFEKFLNDSLLGLNLVAVDPSLFRNTQSFSHWFHGPNDTNVFIWSKGDRIEKAIVELNHQTLTWDHGVLSQGKTRTDLHSAIEDYYSPVIFDAVTSRQNVDPLLLSRVVKLLSQMPQAPKVVTALLGHLREKVAHA